MVAQHAPLCSARHAERTEIALIGWSVCRRSAPTRQRKSILHAIGCAGGPSFGGPRTTGAQASQSKNQALPVLGKWSSFVLHMIGALVNYQSNSRSNFLYAAAPVLSAAIRGVAEGAAWNNSNSFGLHSVASLVHTCGHAGSRPIPLTSRS